MLDILNAKQKEENFYLLFKNSEFLIIFESKNHYSIDTCSLELIESINLRFSFLLNFEHKFVQSFTRLENSNEAEYSIENSLYNKFLNKFIFVKYYKLKFRLDLTFF